MYRKFTWDLPQLFLGMPSCQHSHIGFGSVLYRWSEEVKPPYHWRCGSLEGLSRSILHQSGWWSNIEELDTVKHTPISYPRSLATKFQFCEQSWWLSSLLSTGIYWLTSIPPPNACDPAGHSIKEDTHTYCTSLGIFAHLQWMLWLISMGEAIASHLSTPGKSSCLTLGDCQTIVLLSCCLAVTPFGSRLDWGGASTSIWYLGDTCT